MARFVSEQLGFALCPPFTCIGIERDGLIVGGVLFNHFEGSDVHVSIAGKGWGRELLHAVGDYVYNQLDCERMTIVTASDAVARYAVRLGGQIEGRLRSHYGAGADGIVAGILRAEWKYGNVPAIAHG